MSKTRSGGPKRVAAGLLASALALFGVALAPGAGAAESVEAEANRIAGTTRYGTAAAIAAEDDFDGATNAILATGENFPDALAGSGLAGELDAPILLTRQDELPEETGSGLDSLGTQNVTILGGTAAVSETVETQLEEAGYSVDRIGGVDRYETAALISDEVTAAPIAGDTTAIIATGLNFPDALAGGPVAFAGPHPILLVNDEVPAETEDSLQGIDQAIILGGTAAVSAAVEEDVEEITGSDSIRLAGENRFGTACEVAQFERDTLGWAMDEIILASGVNFPDALAAGPLGGSRQAPILLTSADGLPVETENCLDENSASIQNITPVGGTAAISEETVAAADTAAENVENDPASAGRSVTSVLDGPELQGCRLTDFNADEAWIEYTFEFDEDLDDSVDDALFKLYNADTRNPADGDNDNVDAEAAEVSGPSVRVQFDGADYGATDASLCAVATGAVQDEDGNDNPPQSLAITPLVGAGSQGADLVDAEVEDEDDGEVIFTFNSTVTPAGLAAGLYEFELVLEDGTVIADTAAPETYPDDTESSNQVLVTFGQDLDGDDSDGTADPVLTEFNIARALVNKDANSTLADVIQAVDMGGTDDIPDLESVEFADSNAELGDDEVLFTFDEDVETNGPLTPALFNLYYAICDPLANLAQQCVVEAESLEFDTTSDEVIATFPENSVNEYIAGAFVEGGAVEIAGAGAAENDADGVQTDYNAASGEVAGPQLDSAEFVTETDSFGEFDEYQVIFTFNKDLDTDAVLTDADFAVWINEDGDTEQITMTDCDYDGDTQVVCVDDDEDSDMQNAEVASVDADAVETEDEFTIDTNEEDVQFPNPEGSFEVNQGDDEEA